MTRMSDRKYKVQSKNSTSTQKPPRNARRSKMAHFTTKPAIPPRKPPAEDGKTPIRRSFGGVSPRRSRKCIISGEDGRKPPAKDGKKQ